MDPSEKGYRYLAVVWAPPRGDFRKLMLPARLEKLPKDSLLTTAGIKVPDLYHVIFGLVDDRKRGGGFYMLRSNFVEEFAFLTNNADSAMVVMAEEGDLQF